jgi:MoxR-like ATPase
MRIEIGYPSYEEGKMILERFDMGTPLPSIGSVASRSDITDAQRSILPVRVSSALKDYIVAIIEMTRKHEKIILGVSPRGSLALMKAAKACAVLKGRDFVTPDDVKRVAPPVLAHRIILKGHAISSGASSAQAVIRDILKKVPVPIEQITDNS